MGSSFFGPNLIPSKAGIGRSNSDLQPRFQARVTPHASQTKPAKYATIATGWPRLTAKHIVQRPNCVINIAKLRNTRYGAFADHLLD